VTCHNRALFFNSKVNPCFLYQPFITVVNFSKEELTLPKGTIHGIAQGISENLVVSVIDEENVDRGTEQSFFLEVLEKYQRESRNT